MDRCRAYNFIYSGVCVFVALRNNNCSYKIIIHLSLRFEQ